MKKPQRHINRSYNYENPSALVQSQTIFFDALSDNRIKISELPEISGINNEDILPLVDTDGTQTKKITFEHFKDSAFNVALSGSTNIDLIYNSNNTLSINTKPTGVFDTITFSDNTIQKTSSTQKTVYSIGSASTGIAINYDYDKNIQLLSISSSGTSLSKGSGWPNSSYSVESLLKITVSISSTNVTWSLVDEWYSTVPNTLSSGTHLVLLRAVGTTIEGHYIGSKTN